MMSHYPISTRVALPAVLDELAKEGKIVGDTRTNFLRVPIGVAVRAGPHCVMPLLARYGVTATCRASFAMYNTRNEVDSLVQALGKGQDFFT